MKSEQEIEHERQMDRERRRLHMDRVERSLGDTRRRAEYNSANRNKSRATHDYLLAKGGYGFFGLAALFFLSIFLISPGALLILYVFKLFNYSGPTFQYWIFSLSVSVLIFHGFKYFVKNFKASILLYLVLCSTVTAIAYNTMIDGERAVDLCLEKLMPNFFKGSEVSEGEQLDTPLKTIGRDVGVTNEQKQDGTVGKSVDLLPEPSVVPHVETTGIITKTSESEPEFETSFDCSKANRAIEVMLCSDSSLAALDRRLYAAYKSLIEISEDQESIKREQIDWIKNVTRPCQDKSCVRRVYEARIAELEARMSGD